MLRMLPGLLIYALTLSVRADGFHLKNAYWFTGQGFELGERYVADGRFVDMLPNEARIVSLDGAYVVPPFGDAHNHNLEGSGDRLQQRIAAYLAQGIFYVRNPNNLARTRVFAPVVNAPGTVDVIFANGGLAAPGGHPWDLVKRLQGFGVFKPEDGEGAFVNTIATREDIAPKIETLLASKPDFVKLYLLYSEAYKARKDSALGNDFHGLNPAWMKEIVRRVHAAGVPAVCHVETANDFRVCIKAGADQVLHLPGFRLNEDQKLPDARPFLLSAADAALAGRGNTTVVTTIGEKIEFALSAEDPVLTARIVNMLRHNLLTLYHSGVVLAIGSDNYSGSAQNEILSIARLGIFSNLELLQLWAVNTPLSIFPQRKLGCLDVGCEASLLVLPDDPLTDFSVITRIARRMKDGIWLD